MTDKRTTLKDIAERLDVSVATVSRALSNHPDISNRIKEQANFLVETLHYRPNSFAQHLRSRQSGMIGVITPKVIHYFSSSVISGIMSAANEAGYKVLICESGHSVDEEKENLWRLIDAGVDGLLVSVSNYTHTESHFAEIQEQQIPIVFFDKVPQTIKGTKVLTNDYRGAYEATEHLISQGYKRIAHFRGQQDSRNALPRYKGYRDALKKYKITFYKDLLKICKNCDEEEGYQYAKEIMMLQKPPDAIFCINDETAIGALSALRELNIEIPRHLGVVGFSDSKAASYMFPALSSVAQSGVEIGRKSFTMLHELMRHKERINIVSDRTEVLEPKLIIRASSMRNKNV